MADARFNIVFSGELVAGADPETVKANLAKVFKMDAARVEKLFGGGPVVLKKNADQATAMKFRAVLKKAGAQCQMKPVADEAASPQAGPAHEPVRERASFAARDPQTPSLSERAAQAEQQRRAGNEADAPQEAVSGEREGEGASATAGYPEVEEIEAAPPPEPASAADSSPPPDGEFVGTIRMGGTGFSKEFDVAPAGADIADASEQQDVVDPDISHLSMAPPGTDLEELPREKPVEVPDISHLSLEKSEDS
jgi:hypothetical protein